MYLGRSTFPDHKQAAPPLHFRKHYRVMDAEKGCIVLVVVRLAWAELIFLVNVNRVAALVIRTASKDRCELKYVTSNSVII